jgi:glycosyltransferase involved in cell wall biosynthesis
LFLSRIHPKKGADILINVYIDLIKTSNKPITEWPSLIVAGPGMETEYGEALLQKVLDNGLKEKIKFTGMLSNDSKWGAFSIPVMISNQINIWREIAEGSAGLVCDDNEVSLRRIFDEWFNLSTEQKGQMGQNALQTYLKCFHVKAATKKMIDLLQ